LAVAFAAAFAWAKTGNRIAARIAMIAMTTRSSMRVKARFNFVNLLSASHCTGVTVNDAFSASYSVKNIIRMHSALLVSSVRMMLFPYGRIGFRCF